MKSSLLILITTILFIASSMAIAFTVNRELDPSHQKDWFAIAFTLPAESTPDFLVTNHAPDTLFRYTIQSRGKPLSTEIFTVETGQTLTLHPDNTNLPKPYTISVFPENDTRKSQSLTRK